MRKFFSIALFLALVLFPQVAYSHGADHTVRVTDDGFEPKEIVINQGETVEFVNERTVTVWPASDIHPTHGIYPEFDPKQGIEPGEEWLFRFEKAGAWSMHDHLNPGVIGTITVQGVEDIIKDSTFKERVFAWIEGAKEKIARTFYKVFPKVLEKKLAQVDMHEVASNPTQIEHYMRLAGAEKVMDRLLVDSGDGNLKDCHQQAHNVGRVAYKIYGSEAFTYGNSACHSGFYHGAMEEFLKEEGTFDLASKIKDVCSQFSTSFSNFECLHGVGHGVMAYKNYDLPEALATCDLLETNYESSSCYGGVFMENIVAAQGSGAVPGHETKWVSNDPHFPCNTLEDGTAMMRECYTMQTSWMLTLLRGNLDAVSAECLKSVAGYEGTCFQSLGRDVAGYMLRDPHKIVDACERMPKDYRERCLLGAEYVIMDFFGEELARQAAELCDLAWDQPTMRSCFLKIKDRIGDIFEDNIQAQERACASADPYYQNFCLGIYE